MSDVAELLDKQAICERIWQYAHAIDRQDDRLLASLCTKDATLAYGLFNGSVKQLIEARAGPSPIVMTHHMVSNILIRLDGDRAVAQSYLSVVHRANRDGVLRDEHVRARYLDQLKRIEGRWLFAERILVYDWSATLDADALPWWDMHGEGAQAGSRGGDDPSAALDIA